MAPMMRSGVTAPAGQLKSVEEAYSTALLILPGTSNRQHEVRGSP